jgi:hypothetical protein
MAERWLPVLAAVLGLLGGIGGAAVGGYVANKGQEQQFEEERAARIRDERLDTYVRFLRAAENERIHPVETSDDVINTASAEVALVARSAALRGAAEKLTASLESAVTGSESQITEARERFVDLAHSEIETGT